MSFVYVGMTVFFNLHTWRTVFSELVAVNNLREGAVFHSSPPQSRECSEAEWLFS